MSINEILQQKNTTRYRLWKESGVPQATISDISSKILDREMVLASEGWLVD